MQGAFRPPDDTVRRPRRSELLFQMSRNGMLVHADNSDLSYKAILTRVASAEADPGARGTYGLALEALSGARLDEARRVLVRAAILRSLQEVALAAAILAAACRASREHPRRGGGGDVVAPALAAGFVARALSGAAAVFDFVRPLLPEGAAPKGVSG